MEIKRVLINKKIIISFFVLLAVCIGFYINDQYRNAEYNGVQLSAVCSEEKNLMSEIRDLPADQIEDKISRQYEYVSVIEQLLSFNESKKDDYDMYVEVWQDQEKEIRNQYPEIASEFDKHKESYNAQELTNKDYALNNIVKRAEYVNGYSDYIKSVESKAQQMNSISIFSQDNSLSSQNIQLTAEAYKPLENLSLKVGSDFSVTTVLNYDLIHYIILALNIIVVLAFVEERKRGFWSMVYATPNGRFNLAVKRCGILAISTTILCFVMYFALFVTSFSIYGGVSDLFRNVQSIEMFQNFVFPMSEIQFLFVYVLINVLAQLVPVYMMLFIVVIMQNTNLAFGVCGIIFAAEFLLYTFLPSQSNLAILKYMNLFTFINPTEAIVKYYNINSFVILVNLFSLLIISAIIFTLLFAIFSIIGAGKKYPNKTPGKIESVLLRFSSKIRTVYWKCVEKLSATGTELYKILFMQKGIIVLLAFVLALFNSLNLRTLNISEKDSIVNEFYETHSGELNDDVYKYVADLENEINAVDEELANAYEDYKNGKISEDKYYNVSQKYDAYDSKREALKIINERISYVEDAKKNGEDAWLVNPTGFEYLLGSSGYDRQQNFALLSVFCIIIIMSGVFSFEKRQLISDLLNSTSGGRKKLLRKKILCVSLIATIVWICASVFEFIEVCSKYTLSEITAPVKSLEFLNGLPFNCSILMFMIFVYAVRLLLILAITYVVCLVSAKTKFEVSIVVASAVMIIPSLIYVAGVQIFAYFSATVPVALMKLVVESSGFTFLIPIALMLIMGFVAVKITKYSMCRKGGD